MEVQQRQGQQRQRQQHMPGAAVALQQLHTLSMKTRQLAAAAAGWMLRHTSQQLGMICRSCWVLTLLVMPRGDPHPLLQRLCSGQ